ncbi:hypothetical protein ABEG18_19100 [Alsobacter sp. KACC 23698]|uniref:Uncharacterized protein n=1 Tax=Alsobacter sp. KACC 23698 TaxID=3149229 RepID=A0AAU7JCS0_9HYPH
MKLPRKLLPAIEMSRQEKAAAQAERRSLLTQIAKKALESKGYAIGDSLRVPGAHGFEAAKAGETVRFGIKTAADRWLSVPRNEAGEFGLLEKVDVLLVVTLDEWPNAKEVQIYKFDPAEIIRRAKLAYDQAERLQQTGFQFLPFDKAGALRAGPGRAAGYLLEVGEIFFREMIEWTSSSEDSVAEVELEKVSPVAPEVPETTPATSRRSLTLQEAKDGLAATFGVSPDAIEITIRG